MKLYVKLLSAVTLLSMSVFAFAEAQVVAKVTHVRVDKDGKGYVRFEPALGKTPAACINGHPNHLAFNVNTPAGQGIMSLALAAQASGRRIMAVGTGTCDVYGSVESWHWGYITD